MKAGNVSSASDISLAFAGMNAQQNSCMATGNTDSFNDIMNRKTEQSLIPEFGSTRQYEQVRKTSAKSDGNNDVRRIVASDKSKVTAARPARKDDAKISEAAREIISTVSDALLITDEELLAKLQELGFTVADITEPQNMAVLIADISDTAVTALVTDTVLGAKLSELLDKVSKIVENYAGQLGISPGELVEDIKMAVKEPDLGESSGESDKMPAESDMKDADAEDGAVTDVRTAVVRDEATGKEIRVTMENRTGETIEAKAVGDIRKTEENQTQTGEENRHDSKGQNAMHAAQGILDNLTQAVTESAGGTSFGNSGNVNGTDVFNQILDAIRVNVSQDTTSMEIQLTPENLGKVSLTVSATREGILTASIVTQNEAVKAAVENQIVQLKEALNNQGLKIQDVQVTVASHGFDANDGMQDRSNDDRRQRTSGRHFRSEAGAGLIEDDTNTNAEQTMMEIKGSSVSYTA